MLKASEKSKLNLVWYNPRRSRDTESGSLAGARPGPPPPPWHRLFPPPGSGLLLLTTSRERWFLGPRRELHTPVSVTRRTSVLFCLVFIIQKTHFL